LAAGGAWGIGSDSHISVSPVEELRWLEYGQRLVTRHRNIAVGPASSSTGESLLHGVLASGARATGFAATHDAIVLDAQAPQLVGAKASDLVDRWLFSGNRPCVREVQVAGRTVVADGHHAGAEDVLARY